MSKDSTRAKSSKQEKRIAKAIGGRQVVGSGSTPFLKGDVIAGDFPPPAGGRKAQSGSPLFRPRPLSGKWKRCPCPVRRSAPFPVPLRKAASRRPRSARRF